MATPQLYRQLLGATHAEETSARRAKPHQGRMHPLFEQFGQWIIPKDLRHLKNCAEIVAAILESESACAAHWRTYLSHRDSQARSHMERLSYFMSNPAINDEVLYVPLLKQFLKEWTGQLNLDLKIISLAPLISYGRKSGILKP